MILSQVKCNKKNSMAFYVKGSYIEFTLDVFGLVTGLSTKSSSSVSSSIREKGGGSRLLNTYFDGAGKLKMGDLKKFMETRKGEVQNNLYAVKLAEIYILGRVLLGGRLTKVIYANLIMILEDADMCREYGWGELSFDETISTVEAFSLEHKLPSNNDNEDKRFSLLNQKLDLKVDGDILSNKQPDNLQGESSRDPMVDDQYDDSTEKRSVRVLNIILFTVQSQGHTNRVVLDSNASLPLIFHDHDKLFFDIRASAFKEKKRQAEEGKNSKGHSNEKEEAAEERTTGLGPLNMKDMRQAKNQEKNAGAEDLLPFP
ncbi:hypothetical protein FXO38_31748 [Capsicum annuum]|nr:hypothetical protein FXO38_31748 [Capsicum annuum]KAF3622507.1 hypothetical protein FXO37_32306 [Capsicum annuum]